MTPCPHAVLFLVLGDPAGTYWRCDRCPFRVAQVPHPRAVVHTPVRWRLR